MPSKLEQIQLRNSKRWKQETEQTLHISYAQGVLLATVRENRHKSILPAL